MTSVSFSIQPVLQVGSAPEEAKPERVPVTVAPMPLSEVGIR